MLRSTSRSARSDRYAGAIGWFVEVAHHYGTVIPERVAIQNDVRTIARQGRLRRLTLEAVGSGQVEAAWWAVLNGTRLDLCEPDPVPGTHQLTRCDLQIVVYVDGDLNETDLLLAWPRVEATPRERHREGVIIALSRRDGTCGTIHSYCDDIELPAPEAQGFDIHDKVAFTPGRTTDDGRRLALFVTKAEGSGSGHPDPTVRRTARFPECSAAPYGMLQSRPAATIDASADRWSWPLFRSSAITRGLRVFVAELVRCLAKMAAYKVTALLLALITFLLYRLGIT